MIKEKFLKELESAKTSHVKWHAYAQTLVMEIEAEEKKIPELYTDCKFGKWYYGEGHLLSFIEEFQEVAHIHEKIHNLYMEIYNKYLTPERKSFFISSSKAKKLKKKEIEALSKQLKQTSDNMIDKLSNIIKIINSMSEGEIKYRINKIY